MKKERMTFTIDRNLADRLRAMDVNMSNLIESMIQSYVEVGGIDEYELKRRKEDLERELKAVKSQLKSIRRLKRAEHEKYLPYVKYYKKKSQTEWPNKERWIEQAASKLGVDPENLEDKLVAIGEELET